MDNARRVLSSLSERSAKCIDEVSNAFAVGNVTGAAGTGGVDGEGSSTTLGGLVGVNQGGISNSSAFGNVGGANVANLQAGGLVGDNSGAILSSTAFGNVQAGDGSNAGGLVASNSAFACNGCTNGDGSPFFNTAAIFNSHAFGDVTVGATSVAGGFVGAGDGLIANSTAFGNVLGGGNSVLGGFIGTLSFENGAGVILTSGAAGSVTSTGPNSIVGGFAGLTSGTIVASVSTGPVTGTSDSYLGGFAGVNLGTIAASFTTPGASVTGTGTRDIVGGFVGANFGSIDSSSSAGNATGGAFSTVGGFAGTNARFVNFAPGSIPASSFPSGSITNSSASGSATGGAGQHDRSVHRVERSDLRLAAAGVSVDRRKLQRCAVLLRQYRHPAAAHGDFVRRVPAVPGGAADAGHPGSHLARRSSPRSAPRPWSAISRAPSRRRRSRRRGRRAPAPLPADGRSCPASSAGSWIFRRPPRPA